MKSFIAEVPYLEKINHAYHAEEIATMTSLFLAYSVGYYCKLPWATVENLTRELKSEIGIKSLKDFTDVAESDMILVPEEFAGYIKTNEYSIAFQNGKAVVVVEH